MKVAVVIPAAGSSMRFGDRDKLAQDLGGRPLLLRTVEVFTKCDEVVQILVAAPPDALDEFKDQFGAPLGFLGVTVVPGGRTARWESVRAALDHIQDDASHVIVHDAARPAVSPRLLRDVLTAAETYDAVIPGVPVVDTLKRVEAAASTVAAAEEDVLADSILGDAGKVTVTTQSVVETIDRGNLMAIQTPQCFTLGLLRHAFASADLDGVTDDAMAVERLGEPVHVIPGDPTNMKVTTPEDLQTIRLIMGIKGEAKRPAHKRF
jgi:2-C-methyl-D-erythritol 4-phosphate cytidylyltransferase